MEPLAAALRITEQIPNDRAYEHEHLFCWLAVGKSALVAGDVPTFEKARAALPESREGAELRIAALNGPSEAALEVLADFRDRLAFWEQYLWPDELNTLAARLVHEFGLTDAGRSAAAISDPFTRAVFLVELAETTHDRVLKQSLLAQAIEAADQEIGDHDYALRHIIVCYANAGMFDEAEDVLTGITDPSIRLDLLEEVATARAGDGETWEAARLEAHRERVSAEFPDTISQSALVDEASLLLATNLDGSPSYAAQFSSLGKLLLDGLPDEFVATVKERFPTRFCPPALELPDEQLRELLLVQLDAVHRYRRNDLKVEYLTDLADAFHRAGRTLPIEVDAFVEGELLALEQPSRPSVTLRDPSLLMVDELAALLFDRPVATTDEEDRFMRRSRDDDQHDANTPRFIPLVTQLLTRFGEFARPYSPEQVEQAVWYLIGFPFRLQDVLMDPDLPAEVTLPCLRAAYHVFADYVAATALEESSTGFFMWWDSYCWGDAPDHIQVAAVETTARILELDDRHCRQAALHGLNHLKDAPGAKQAIATFIDRHGHALDADLLSYAQICLAGEAM